MQWREDWNRRHVMMEQERQKAASVGAIGAFAQTGVKDFENDIST